PRLGEIGGYIGQFLRDLPRRIEVMRFHGLIRALEQQIGARAAGMGPAGFELAFDGTCSALISRFRQPGEELLFRLGWLWRRTLGPCCLRRCAAGSACSSPGSAGRQE